MESAPPPPGAVIRLLCSLPVVATGAAALLMASRMSHFEEIFENMVHGGVSALPPVTRWMLENRLTVMALAALVLAGVLWIIWKHRNGILVLAVSVAVSGFFTLSAVLISWLLQQSLMTVIQKFQGV